MEEYVAGIFATKEQAAAARAALLQLSRDGGVRIEKAAVCTRDVGGNLSPEDVEMCGFDPSLLPGGLGQQALDELNQTLPHDAHVLVAHVVVGAPAVLDAAIQAHGGSVWRRSIDDLKASGYRRFMDAGSL